MMYCCLCFLQDPIDFSSVNRFFMSASRDPTSQKNPVLNQNLVANIHDLKRGQE